MVLGGADKWCKNGATAETRITEARKTDGAEDGAMVQL
jgi:hypothetical protein